MGEGHLQGKSEFGGDSSKVGTSCPMISSLGHDTPSRLPPWRSTPELKGLSPSSLWSARSAALQGEERHPGAPNWGSKGLHPTTLENPEGRAPTPLARFPT